MKKLWQENKTAMIALFFGAIILLVFVLGFILRGQSEPQTVFTSGALDRTEPTRIATPISGITRYPTITPMPTKSGRLNFGDKYMQVNSGEKYTIEIYYDIDKIYYPKNTAAETNALTLDAKKMDYIPAPTLMPTIFLNRLDLAELKFDIPNNLNVTDIEARGTMSSVYVDRSQNLIQLANLATDNKINHEDPIAILTFTVGDNFQNGSIKFNESGTKLSSNGQIWTPALSALNITLKSDTQYEISDLNSDGQVCFFTDAMIFIEEYKKYNTSTDMKKSLVADLNNDGTVNILDFAIFVKDYKDHVAGSDC